MTDIELVALCLMFCGLVGVVLAIILQGISSQVADLTYYVSCYMHVMVYRPLLDNTRYVCSDDDITTD